MTTRQASELRIVLQHIAITQAMFRDAVARFERLATEAGHPVMLIAADDFTIYETGASREDLDFIVERYKRGDETDPLDTLTPDQLRDIVRQIRQILALDTDEQWTPETIEQVLSATSITKSNNSITALFSELVCRHRHFRQSKMHTWNRCWSTFEF
jgi:hypothetical protein